MDSQLPVLIVGAGPSGLAMASALAHLKIPFRIIDKNNSIVSGSNATWLQPRTLQFFSILGVIGQFLKKGHRCHSLDLRARGKTFGLIPFAQNGSIYPFVLMLPQCETEKLLTGHLETQGVTVERSVTLRELTQTADHAVATLRMPEGQDESASFSWVIACDGSASTVREICHTPFVGSPLPGQFVVADAVMSTFLSPGELHVFFDRETVCAVFPIGSQRYRISANLHQSHPRKIFTEMEVREIVAERTDGNFTVDKVSWISPFWTHSRLIENMRQGRVFFVGDAAHMHSPAGGQGLNSGIQDVSNLAFKLALVMQGLADSAFLDSYHAERHPVISHTVAASEKFTRIVQSKVSVRKKWDELIAPSPETLPAQIGRQIAQMHVCYDSPVISLSGRKDVPSAPQPGECAPDATLGAGVSLYTALQAMKHVVLIFCGEEDVSATLAFQHHCQEKFKQYAKVLRVMRTADTEDAVLADPQGILHALYHVGAAALYVIRPDGHVAGCSSDLDMGVLEAVFSKYRRVLK